MNTRTITHLVLVALTMSLFLLAACASEPAKETPATDSGRLAALEAEVKTLKLEAQAREDLFKEELARIGKNLDAIRDLIAMDKSRAQALEDPKPPTTEGPKTEADTLDEELDTKAKSFVSENLDRLLSITKKLLDKMEKELDKQTEKTEPAPDGDAI